MVKTMTARGKAYGILVLLASLLVIHNAQAQKKAPSPTLQDRQREQHSLAINMVRAINAAETSYKQKHGVYTTWDTFFSAGDFTDSGTKWAPESLPTVKHAMYGRGPEIVPGWKLRLTVSKDGNAYDLLLEDANDPKCRYAVSSDERGLVRQGTSVDCPQ
jgi:hypothetical protein